MAKAIGRIMIEIRVKFITGKDKKETNEIKTVEIEGET